jgi:hypothetical protein
MVNAMIEAMSALSCCSVKNHDSLREREREREREENSIRWGKSMH